MSPIRSQHQLPKGRRVLSPKVRVVTRGKHITPSGERLDFIRSGGKLSQGGRLAFRIVKVRKSSTDNHQQPTTMTTKGQQKMIEAYKKVYAEHPPRLVVQPPTVEKKKIVLRRPASFGAKQIADLTEKMAKTAMDEANKKVSAAPTPNEQVKKKIVIRSPTTTSYDAKQITALTEMMAMTAVAQTDKNVSAAPNEQVKKKGQYYIRHTSPDNRRMIICRS